MNIVFLPTSYNVLFVTAIISMMLWWGIDTIKEKKINWNRNKEKEALDSSFSWRSLFLSLLLTGGNLLLYMDLSSPFEGKVCLYVLVILTIINVLVLSYLFSGFSLKEKVCLMSISENAIITFNVIVFFFIYLYDYVTADIYKDYISIIGTKAYSFLNVIVSAAITFCNYKLILKE